jgi:hypothetical protein
VALSYDRGMLHGRRRERARIDELFAARDDQTREPAVAGLPELRLTGLDPAAAQALLSEVVAVAPGVSDMLVASTAGNPLGCGSCPRR